MVRLDRIVQQLSDLGRAEEIECCWHPPFHHTLLPKCEYDNNHRSDEADDQRLLEPRRRMAYHQTNQHPPRDCEHRRKQ